MDQQASLTVSQWLSDLTEEKQLSRKTLQIVHTLSSNPRLGSYGSIRAVAEKATVSIGTVTRAAQALGFAGWPALQEELRARYLTSLSVTEVAAHRQGGQEKPAYASLSRDRDNINTFIRSVDLAQLTRAAEAIARSRHTYIVAPGSGGGIGKVLEHAARLHGYDTHLLAEEAQIPNTVALSGPQDLVIVISFWRLYASVYDSIQSCHERGIPVVLFTETVPREVEQLCSEVIRVPTEGIGFSPALTSATALVHGIVAELIALDPARSTRTIESAEREWERFGLMHRY